MKLLRLFFKSSPNKMFFSIMLGSIAGACYAAIIPLILSALNSESIGIEKQDSSPTIFLFWEVSNHKYAFVFTSVCLFILFARTLSQVILIRLSMDVTSELRKDIYKKIAKAKIADIERIGDAKLLAVLTADIPRIIIGARQLPDLLMNSVSLLAMLLFVRYINENVFWFVMECIAFGIVTYQIPMLIGHRYLTQSRGYFDELYKSINGLIYGLKELKLNRKKREAYFDNVLSSIEDKVKASEKKGRTVLRVAINYGDLLSFFVIGAVSFIFVNYEAISTPELIAVIMVLLYITTPVALLLDFIPQFVTANVSLKKVHELGIDIPPENCSSVQEVPINWHSIRFSKVEYQYRDCENGSGFKVGPLDFDIKRGEITFIVGGNGSGKSTLSKLITLHYHASSGDIYFGSELANGKNIESLRQDICAIYSDYYLFDSLLGYDHSPQMQSLIDHYLKVFALDKKVSAENGKFSTLSLSDGQKRRLALLVAFVEDKKLYIFDEWAADQDPDFKAVFYREILPKLKILGKAVVVISHDDRYFDLADNLIVMSEGKIERVERQNIAIPLPVKKDEENHDIQQPVF